MRVLGLESGHFRALHSIEAPGFELSDKDKKLNAVSQRVLQGRTGRSVVGWSVWEGAFGLRLCRPEPDRDRAAWPITPPAG